MKFSETIQLGSLAISGICMIGGFWMYCESHFALATDQKEIKTKVAKHDELISSMHDQLLRVEFATGADKIRIDPKTQKPTNGR